MAIIEKRYGHIIGGFSNTPCTSDRSYCTVNKEFLFALSHKGNVSPRKLNTKDSNETDDVNHEPSFGPMLDKGHNLTVVQHHVIVTLDGPFHLEVAQSNQRDGSVLTGLRAWSHICDHLNNKPPYELAILRDLAN